MIHKSEVAIEQLKALDQEQGAAWKVFCRQYGREHPEPHKPRGWHGLPWAMLPYGIVGTAAAVLSAMRTAPVFTYVATQFSDVAGTDVSRAAGFEGFLATVVVDFAVIVFRFAMVVQNQENQEHRKTSGWVSGGFGLALFAQIAANIYGTMGVLDASEKVQDWANLIIMLVAGLSGVIIALAIGEILGHQWLASQDKRRALQADYATLHGAWVDGRNRRWGKSKKKMGVRSLEVRERSRTDENFGEVRGNSENFSRTRLKPSELQVIQFLENNTGADSWRQVDVVKATGRAKSTVSVAMKMYREGVRSENGHEKDGLG